VEGGATYKQVYNAKNRLYIFKTVNGTGVSGNMLEKWVFSYDSDEVRVKLPFPLLSLVQPDSIIAYQAMLYLY
jgi:hypothetical protein